MALHADVTAVTTPANRTAEHVPQIMISLLRILRCG
jgi:hypothetical protein